MSFSIVGPIPDTITKSKKSVGEFILQLSKINNELLIYISLDLNKIIYVISKNNNNTNEPEDFS